MVRKLIIEDFFDKKGRCLRRDTVNEKSIQKRNKTDSKRDTSFEGGKTVLERV